jgi:hypothetical protein
MNKQYFCVLWKHQSLSQEEIKLNGASNCTFFEWNKSIICFEHDNAQTIQKRWGIVKRWIIQPLGTIYNQSNKPKIIGVPDKEYWSEAKKHGIKRFKITELISSDLEIKHEWQEIVAYNKNVELLVTWYQHIDLYECIDFNKPQHGMWVGMMPSKLAHSLINIAIGLYQTQRWTNKTITIYDPFCWFWTTNFVANAQWYDTIWSDKNITAVKKNVERRKKQSYATDKKLLFFKHDVTKIYQKNFLNHVTCIVTEWWLGPIVRQKIPFSKAQEEYNKIFNVYQQRIQHTSHFFDQNISMCFCIPEYTFFDHEDQKNYLQHRIIQCLEQHWRICSYIDKAYMRAKQFVGRKIIYSYRWSTW